MFGKSFYGYFFVDAFLQFLFSFLKHSKGFIIVLNYVVLMLFILVDGFWVVWWLSGSGKALILDPKPFLFPFPFLPLKYYSLVCRGKGSLLCSCFLLPYDVLEWLLCIMLMVWCWYIWFWELGVNLMIYMHINGIWWLRMSYACLNSLWWCYLVLWTTSLHGYYS